MISLPHPVSRTRTVEHERDVDTERGRGCRRRNRATRPEAHRQDHLAELTSGGRAEAMSVGSRQGRLRMIHLTCSAVCFAVPAARPRLAEPTSLAPIGSEAA
jgi:hypothetical protein